MKLKIVVGPVCKEDYMCPSGKARRGQSTRQRARPPVGLGRRDAAAHEAQMARRAASGAREVGRGRRRGASNETCHRWGSGGGTQAVKRGRWWGWRRHELGDGGDAREEAGEGRFDEQRCLDLHFIKNIFHNQSDKNKFTSLNKVWTRLNNINLLDLHFID